ncbi:MAG: hypothetical protein JWM16_6356 [Verrucomicrobiales bacterium]|nr:hypothetical protein [Verrucomicrobiales bacterium]
MANALMATGLQQPNIDTMGAFAQGVNARQTTENNQIELARKGMENIGAIALGSMGGKLDGPVDPEKFKQGLDLLEQQGVDVSKFRDHPEIAPIAARASMTALQQLNAAHDQASMDLALKNFGLELRKANAPPAAPAPTDDQRELSQINTERKAAGKPELGMEDFLASKKGNGITITNPDGTTTQIGGSGNKGTDAYDVETNKGLAKLSADLADAGRNASSQISKLGQMKTLLSNDQVYTGPAADQVQALQRAAKSFGVDTGVENTETFNALTKAAVLDKMGGSLGTGVSNADRDYIDGQVPNMANTKDGNLALIDVMEKVAQRSIDIAKFAADYKKAHNGRLGSNFNDELATWAEQNPMFKGAPAGGASPAPTETGVGGGAVVPWDDPSLEWSAP